MQGGKYKKKNRVDGKVVIITGCNTGVGKETALELAKRGAKVYMACRDLQRGEEARKEIFAITKNPNLFTRELDLASLDSVRRFSKK
jgi:NAD(P)-dependent dehydrogenase (short-subunit alcohol dehydrogenase family)